MRESRTYGSVRGQCREALVYSTVGLLIDRRHLALFVLVVSENILKKIKIIYISHLD